MKIIDLDETNEPLFFLCLEDWSDEIREAGDHKEKWYRLMKDKGLQVKLALDDQDRVGGMIQYLPIEHTFTEGKDLYQVLCIWVHGHKEGRGNFQKKGMGKALLAAAEADVRERGAKGMAAWGVSLPFWMRASWFRKQGYKKADKEGIRMLLWKPFTPEAQAPCWIKARKKPVGEPGKVTVSGFLCGWCPAMNMVFERAKRAAGELGDKVTFREIDTSDPDNFREWGITDAVFVDDKEIRNGPPPSFEKIRKKIAKKAKKLM